jgi:transcriptional regulator with XRE-family HTH domain
MVVFAAMAQDRVSSRDCWSSIIGQLLRRGQRKTCMTKVHSYVRAHRKRWGLSQADLARLLGVKASTTISRLEGFSRLPDLRTALCVEIIFGVPVRELFPKFSDEVEARLLERANDFYEELQGNASPLTKAKLDFLETIFERTGVNA